MTALAAFTQELARIRMDAPSDPAADARAQLAQVQARIRDALASRDKAPTQRAWREVNERLHRLYVLESDVKRDLAGL